MRVSREMISCTFAVPHVLAVLWASCVPLHASTGHVELFQALLRLLICV